MQILQSKEVITMYASCSFKQISVKKYSGAGRATSHRNKRIRWVLIEAVQMAARVNQDHSIIDYQTESPSEKSSEAHAMYK
jgi:hypothetical protein